jgi:hypothetical protein
MGGACCSSSASVQAQTLQSTVRVTGTITEGPAMDAAVPSGELSNHRAELIPVTVGKDLWASC